MEAYNLNVVHDEDDTLNLSHIVQNINVYTRELNNRGDYTSMFIPDNRHLCDTIISENTDLRRNNIP